MNYRDAIKALVRKHRLGFMHNPGGGEFNHPVHGRCQISFCDDEEDYLKLLSWLQEKNLEPKA